MADSILVRAAAKRLKVSVETLRRWRKTGVALPAGWKWDAAKGRHLRMVPPSDEPTR